MHSINITHRYEPTGGVKPMSYTGPVHLAPWWMRSAFFADHVAVFGDGQEAAEYAYRDVLVLGSVECTSGLCPAVRLDVSFFSAKTGEALGEHSIGDMEASVMGVVSARPADHSLITGTGD